MAEDYDLWTGGELLFGNKRGVKPGERDGKKISPGVSGLGRGEGLESPDKPLFLKKRGRGIFLYGSGRDLHVKAGGRGWCRAAFVIAEHGSNNSLSLK